MRTALAGSDALLATVARGGLRRLGVALLDLIYPRACAVCGAWSCLDRHHLCWDCAAGFEPVSEPFCARCGDPVDGRTGVRYECSACRRAPPAFRLARSALRYRGPLRIALQRLKYNGVTCLAPDLADWLEGCYRAHYARTAPDAVVCVPLHARRERARGYNQAALLAAALSARLGAPFAPRCLRRTRSTPTQTDLNAAQRRSNVRGAFAARNPAWIEGRRLLLVDDVMTTGATVAECAATLMAAGAADVLVLTVARG